MSNFYTDTNNQLLLSSSATSITHSTKPYLIYGTAWKKDETSRLVHAAINSGFRFIDTACQPKHYNEAKVGIGWTLAAKELHLKRTDIFLQTKFTSIEGQDVNHPLPYDPSASLEVQVQQSLQTSLKNLQTEYIDCLILHSPMNTMKETFDVWKVMESFVINGIVKSIGISNCYNYSYFTSFYSSVTVKPSVLQNRFTSRTNFDQDLRSFCNEHDITYQSFWTLTANQHELRDLNILHMAKEKSLTPETLMYVYMMTLGHIPLDGTTSITHMKEDVDVMKRIIDNNENILNTEDILIISNVLGDITRNVK